jgi:hypothetical protein
MLLVAVIACIVAACGASGKSFVASTPTSGNGLVYVYRTSRFVGSVNVWDLRANGVRVTAVRNGGYFPYDSKPGNVTFSGKLRSNIGTWTVAPFMADREMITINVQPGEVYFVKFDHKGGGAYMELVDKKTGEEEIRDLKMLERLEE